MWHVHSANAAYQKRCIYYIGILVLCVLYLQSSGGRRAAVHLPEETVPSSVCSGRAALRTRGKFMHHILFMITACVTTKACQPCLLICHILLTGFRCRGWSTCKYQQVHGGSFGLHHTFQSGETTTVFSDGYSPLNLCAVVDSCLFLVFFCSF